MGGARSVPRDGPFFYFLPSLYYFLWRHVKVALKESSNGLVSTVPTPFVQASAAKTRRTSQVTAGD